MTSDTTFCTRSRDGPLPAQGRQVYCVPSSAPAGRGFPASRRPPSSSPALRARNVPCRTVRSAGRRSRGGAGPGDADRRTHSRARRPDRAKLVGWRGTLWWPYRLQARGNPLPSDLPLGARSTCSPPPITSPFTAMELAPVLSRR